MDFLMTYLTRVTLVHVIELFCITARIVTPMGELFKISRHFYDIIVKIDVGNYTSHEHGTRVPKIAVLHEI